MTGIVENSGLAWSREQNSYPSISDMIASRRMRSGRVFRNVIRARAPLSAVITEYPLLINERSKARRVTLSSSTHRMTGVVEPSMSFFPHHKEACLAGILRVRYFFV